MPRPWLSSFPSGLAGELRDSRARPRPYAVSVPREVLALSSAK